MKRKIAIGVAAALASAGLLGLKTAWPWIAPPPLPMAQVEARWSTVLNLAELPEMCAGEAAFWETLVEAATNVSPESRELVQERYGDDLPLPREALPEDLETVLGALVAWHETGGRFVSLDNPLVLHTVQQTYSILENPTGEEEAAVVGLAAHELRCGSPIDFAMGLRAGMDLMAAMDSRSSLDSLVLTQSEMVAVVAREATSLWSMLGEIGDDGVALEVAALPFVPLSRELKMFRWYYGEVVTRGLEAESISDAVSALGWMFGPERRSALIDITAPNFSVFLEDYAAFHATLMADR
jgi:hypothetical protein